MSVDRRRGGGRRAEELETALREQQVEILYQPLFACADGRLVGAEALSRWHHPRLGRIGAEALFDIAERAGEAARLTRHIAGRALATAAAWPAHLHLSLNVTAADLAEENFAETIADAVAVAGFAPARLTLEITEHALVRDLEEGAAQLERLAAQGVRIALDDFGAGFCNFGYLKRLPLDALKLDRSMIEGIAEDERDLAVLRGILAMAKALGLAVTAEGIETEAQRVVAAREGCAVWQGFLGGQPMSTTEFAQLAAG
jgi:EAL domain-containing protein (putative c-di-GMP-specific phosphodiesterase class I)